MIIIKLLMICSVVSFISIILFIGVSIVKKDKDYLGYSLISFVVFCFVFTVPFSDYLCKFTISREPSYYINKFKTKDYILIEYPNGEFKKIIGMKYLNDSIYVEKVTKIYNNKNDTIISYKVKE